MIGWLRGVPRDLSGSTVLVDVSGVGYEVYCVGEMIQSIGLALREKTPVEIFIHTEVREDALQLFGFQTLLDRRVFLLLTSVKGVGAKLAAIILGNLSARDLMRAIGLRDHLRLQQVKGVGKKTA